MSFALRIQTRSPLTPLLVERRWKWKEKTGPDFGEGTAALRQLTRRNIPQCVRLLVTVLGVDMKSVRSQPSDIMMMRAMMKRFTKLFFFFRGVA